MKEEVEVTHREEFVRVQQTITREMTDPGDCFVPVLSAKVTKEERGWRVEVEFAGEYESLEKARCTGRKGSSEAVIGLVSSLLSSVRLAGRLLHTGFQVSPRNIYISANSHSVKLSPILPISDTGKCAGLSTVIEQMIGLAVDGEGSSVAAGLITELKEVASVMDADALAEWFPSGCAKAYVRCLNSELRAKQINEGSVAVNLRKIIDMAVHTTISLCMNPTCPGESASTEHHCEFHPFCSVSCRSALQVANNSPSDQCPVCFLSHRKTDFLCVCGKSLNTQPTDWQLNYYGSTVYSQVSKYCSEDCFLAQQPAKPAEAFLSLEQTTQECIFCRKVSPTDLCDGWYDLDCKVHSFCSAKCYQDFRGVFIPMKCKFWPNCLHCSEALRDLARREHKEDTVNHLIERVDSLKETFLKLKSVSTFSKMMDAINETKAVIMMSPSKGVFGDLSLSVKNIRSDVFFLFCINCGRPTQVHKRNRGEMQLWGDTSFLVSCEIHVHAVCSLACLLALKRTSEYCPVCAQFTLKFEWADVSREVTHPTLEVLKHFASHICWCWKGERFVSTGVCAHEICSQCLANFLLESPKSLYRCPVCYMLTEKEVLMEQVFT